MKRIHPATALLFSAALAAAIVPRARAGEPIVPGTGELLSDCCDNFEDTRWSYRYNHPKSSHEQDDNQRGPGGMSSNGLWHEGGKRGTPDVVRRIATPPGGGFGSGTATVAASAGVASFNNLVIDKSGQGYTLSASSGGLTGA